MDRPFLKVITTFDGSNALEGNCRYIKGKYYEENRQCFKMPDGKWHRINNGKITFDHRYREWKFVTCPELTTGVIGTNKDTLVYGTFSSNPDDILIEDGGGIYPVLDESIAKELDLVEDIGRGIFLQRKYVKEDLKGKDYIGYKQIQSYPISLEYNVKNVLKSYYFSKDNFTKSLNFFIDELAGTSFGIEFETWNGTIPMRHLNKLGLIPLKDGSLRHDDILSYEYATIPLSGGEGLYKIKEICSALQRYTEISIMCSTHVHLGGYERSKEFVVTLYKVAKTVESELYKLFPKAYRNTSIFKEKSYCRPLPNIMIDADLDGSFERIYYWLSGGDSFEGFSHEEHPLDPHGNHKWDIPVRYTWLNMVPFLWGPYETVEFRMHPPTINEVKTISWIFICNAILKYANLHKNNWNSLKKSLSLQKIFSAVYNPELAEYLTRYTEHLKTERNRYDEITDIQGKTWCKEDSNICFDGDEVLKTALYEE
jgi:hypothetical protein